MHWLTAIILGLVQGLTEFIPVSSSGHLIIAQIALGHSSDHIFLEFIDIGTLVALLVYFRHRIVAILKDIFVNRRYRLARNILITSVPAGIVGYVLTGFIDREPFFGSIVVVTITLGLVGIVMVVLEKLPHAVPVKNGEHLTGGSALVIGLAQMLALIPGVSRSGSTIIVGRLRGLNAHEAAEYSFLASIPIMIAVAFKSIVDDKHYMMTHLDTLLLSNFVAFVSGFIAIGFLLRYLSKHSLAVFGWYRIGLSVVLAIILLVQYK